VAASAAESRKNNKYAAFSQALIFVPVAIETMGVWALGAFDLIWDLGGWFAVGRSTGCDTFQAEAGCGCSQRKCHLGYESSPQPKDVLLFQDVVR